MSKIKPVDFGFFIKVLRKKKGYKSSRSFAKALNKSATFTWKIEKGHIVPGVKTLEKMSEVLGCRDKIFELAKRIQPEVKEKIVNNSELMEVIKKISKFDDGKIKKLNIFLDKI